jgi:hypothetical protein
MLKRISVSGNRETMLSGPPHLESQLGKGLATTDGFSMSLTLRDLHAALPASPLFGGGSWRWSPEPLPLSRREARLLGSLGQPLARFQAACDEIYRRSAAGTQAPWVAPLLDAGKPDWLVDWQRQPSTLGQQPAVIRPDLILGDSEVALTELDSVPGGIGITAWLSRTYAQAGFEILGGAEGMVDGFRSILPNGGSILVSQESADYRPEMEWLAAALGDHWCVVDAESYVPDGSPVYRFFELFDWQSIPSVRELARRSAQTNARITPSFQAHLEEKLWLALFHAPGLQTIWKRHLRGSHLERLQKIIPRGWIPDPTPLPPFAALPHLNVHSWDEVARFSQSQRRLVLKISGFHETAWGSRGVFIGHDLPADEWRARLDAALTLADTRPHILQEFREGRLIDHPVFREDGSVEIMRGRVRLCPYYFTNAAGYTALGGCLATLVPADKKKIHGMTDGVLVPCCVG